MRNTRWAGLLRFGDCTLQRVSYFTERFAMEYTKPALTFREQAELLVSRGLEGDCDAIEQWLSRINYYRFSGYLYPFREMFEDENGKSMRGDRFVPGTTFRAVCNTYLLDRRLRLLVLDAVEHIEVTVRTVLAYNIAHRLGGPFSYAKRTLFPRISEADFEKFLKTLEAETDRSHESFIAHFKSRYGDRHRVPPVWMAVEIMSFGTLQRLYGFCAPEIKKAVAERFGVHETVFSRIGSTF